MIEGDVVSSSQERLWSPRGLAVTVEDAQGGHRTINVATPFARVGSDERAEVVLPGADILPCHLYLHATEEGIYCLGLSASAPSGWLTPKRRIEVGGYCLKVAFDGVGPPPQSLPCDPRAKDSIASPLPRLRVRLTGDRKHAFELNLSRRITVVGRQPPSTLCVHHPTMSRTHAVLYWDGQLLWAVDLLAANGMRREGEPLVAGVLAESQRIALGDVRCRFLGARAAASQVVAEQEQHRHLAELLERCAALENDLATARRELAASQDAIVVHQTAAENRIGALRESFQQELADAASARDATEKAGARREHELAEAANCIQRLEAELATAQRQVAAAVADTAAVRSSAEEQLAALRHTVDQQFRADEARDVAEKVAAQREHDLAEAADRIQRLEADLATAQRQLVAAEADAVAVRSSAEEQLAALRQTMDQRLQADAAREVAEIAAAQREHELAEAADRIQRLEADLAAAQRQISAAAADMAAVRSSAEERLAALRETMDQRFRADAAREVAEIAAAQREHELAEAAHRIQRLEAELASAQLQLVAAKADTVAVRSSAEEQLAALRQTMEQRLLAEAAVREEARLEQLANYQAEKRALQAAADEHVNDLNESLRGEVRNQVAAREIAEKLTARREHELEEAADRIQRLEADLAVTRRQLAATDIEPATSQTDIAASTSGGNEWAMEDRVIGRLLDFRAKREAARRRSLVWGVAACIALLVLGGAAAAGKAWSSRGQANAPEATANVADPADPSLLP